MVASWTMFLVAGILVGQGPSGRWIGQDGHDFTGTSPDLKPNEYQDVHIALRGLPPGREVARVQIDADGGGTWQYRGPQGSVPAVLKRAPRSATADLYFEPYLLEKGRTFFVHLYFEDGAHVEVHVKGGRADPDLRMPGAGMIARWVGQVRQDRTGSGVGVGPDGFQDVQIALEKLNPKLEIKSATVEAAGGARWQSGLNPKGEPGAEIVRDPKDPSRAIVSFQPDGGIAGKPIKVTIRYNERGDAVTLNAGRFEPKLRMPKVAAPVLMSHAIQARWEGQAAAEGGNPGDVRVSLTGLPESKGVAAAALTDAVRGLWVHRAGDRVKFDAGPFESPLVFKRRRGGRGAAELLFPPYRDEAGASLTLRIVFQDGDVAVVTFPGGACDPALCVPPGPATTIAAKPGDDLNDLANRYATVTLAPGTYRLARPLILNQPVTIAGDRGATLLFAQGPTDPTWTAAIKIHSGRVTLRDLAIRFAGPIRWRSDVSYGPALIGTTDNHDPPHPALKKGLVFQRLDIESPAAKKADGWEEVPKGMRLMNAGAGTISECRIRAGVIEFFGGPWQFLGNDFLGVPPNTFTHGLITGHYANDITVKGNRVKPIAPSGKVWRFATFTNRGSHIRVLENRVEGIGPRDDDKIPSMNAPEILLTESYTLHFEGKVAAVSADRKLLRIPPPQNGTPYAGDVVSVLDGKAAGSWCKIAQVIDATTYLLESPLAAGTEAIALTSAFTDFVIEGNSIDSRGGSQSSNLVLAGNHFGTIVRRNRLAGGEPFRIQACATEAPVVWGWTHVPNLGGLIEGNLIEDPGQRAVLGVEHSAYTKANAGRTYMTATLRNNTIRWSDAYLREASKGGPKGSPKGIVVGYPGALDPGELAVVEAGDRLEAAAAAAGSEAFRINAAIVNGKVVRNRSLPLPRSPIPPDLSQSTTP